MVIFYFSIKVYICKSSDYTFKKLSWEEEERKSQSFQKLGIKEVYILRILTGFGVVARKHLRMKGKEGEADRTRCSDRAGSGREQGEGQLTEAGGSAGRAGKMGPVIGAGHRWRPQLSWSQSVEVVFRAWWVRA